MKACRGVSAGQGIGSKLSWALGDASARWQMEAIDSPSHRKGWQEWGERPCNARRASVGGPDWIGPSASWRFESLLLRKLNGGGGDGRGASGW